jgi:GTPase SAR1 family protein
MASAMRVVHVVFLGPTGSGKSSLYNFLLENGTDVTAPENGTDVTAPENGTDVTAPENGTDVKAPENDECVTSYIQTKSGSTNYNGERVGWWFIDTPGLPYDGKSNAQVIKKVKDALQKKCIPFINCFVMVFKPGRIGHEERNALEDIIKAFNLDDDKRKRHVYFLLSNCDAADPTVLDKYKRECLADRTIQRLLCIENGEIINLNFVGIPRKGEVDDLFYKLLMERMESKRQELWNYLFVPREGIQATKGSFFYELCSIL